MPDIVIVSSSPVDADEEKRARRQYEEEFLSKARERFQRVAEAESELRANFDSDLDFYNGNQWDQHISNSRRQDNRPCLTINRLPQFVHAVSNEIRQNKPAPKISPVDDKGDIETAEVLQGIYRHIERQSNAPAVRSYASFYSIVCGRGWYRVVCEYGDERSFDQEVYLRRIKNPMTVYMDPCCQEPDYSDAKYCFIIDDLTEDEFKSQYPDAEVSSLEDFRSTGDSDPDWAWEGHVRIAEYFTCEYEPREIALLPDGSVMPVEEVPEGTPIVQTRSTREHIVTWTKMSGAEILEQRRWPGRYIPVIAVLGEEYDVDGETQLVGMVRHAKDPARMINYWESAKTEAIALAPRAPYVAAEGQLENHEMEWQQANTRNWAVLQYKPREVGGSLVPAPQRQAFEPPIQAISVAQGGAVDNLKATTGIYDPSLGNRSNETSGIAIQQRLAQGSTSNYHFMDNLRTAINYEAKVIIDLIPKIYDRPGRVMRILGEDDTTQEVVLNAPHQDRQGMLKFYKLDAGRYDVAIDVGPSYQTKRQESVDSMTAFAQAAPQLVPQYADLYVKAMDWPGAQEIAKRVRPPGVGDEGEPQIPPQAMQQMQMLNQQLQEAQAQIDQMAKIIMGKQVESQSREKIAQMDNQTRFAIARMQAQSGMATKQADIGSTETLKYADIDSKEDIAAADNESREQIAMLNARVKATSDQLKFTSDQVKAGVALENGARKQQPNGNRNQ